MDRKKLVERIERIFPHVKIKYDGEDFDPILISGKKSTDIEKIAMIDSEFAPPRELNWYEILDRLEENGLVIEDKDK
jgi:hypothetical protein